MSKKVVVKLKRKYLYVTSFLVLALSTLSLFLFFFLYFYSRIYPGIYIRDVHVGGLTSTEAVSKIQNAFPDEPEFTVELTYDSSSQNFAFPLDLIDMKVDHEGTIDRVYKIGRSGGIRSNFRAILESLIQTKKHNLVINIDQNKLKDQIAVIGTQVPEPPESPTLLLATDKVVFQPGKAGYYLDANRLTETIVERLEQGSNYANFNLATEDPTLTKDQETRFIARGETLLNKNLVLTSPNKEFVLEDDRLLGYLNPKGGFRYDFPSVAITDIVDSVKTPPQNPVFKFEDGKVQEFSPAKDGLEVDAEALKAVLDKSLAELETTTVDSLTAEIPLKRTPPDFATEDVNDLGIKELIGVGTSSYRGSIPSRVYNVAHAASKLNGILIKPGETFSFVNTLGDISALTGYKQAYVIQGNQTILGDGGGVCQVSTTFFRAALAAGLSVVERHPHSYRVAYYEQGSGPGIDATIFHPTVDIKIKNDTPGHILIQTFADSKNLTLRFELYGTSDGRVATIGKPVVTQVTPPPEDLYIDDPTMPTGEIKQVDYKAFGAKVYFDYSVTRNGETIFEKTFNSNYRPWQAKFLRGTGPTQ